MPQEEQPRHVNNGLALWWVEEYGETIIARTEQEAREYYEASEGSESGPVTWDFDVQQEDGTVTPVSEMFMAVTADPDNDFPYQLTTEYS